LRSGPPRTGPNKVQRYHSLPRVHAACGGGWQPRRRLELGLRSSSTARPAAPADSGAKIAAA